MNYDPMRRKFGWTSCLTIAAIAALLLPMAPAAGEKPTAGAQKPADESAPDGALPANPRVVKTSPPLGATGVDPALNEIAVTFDRDMAQGMSWTGGPLLFPPLDSARKARWTDARTCVLPVKLAAASYYRLGVNSSGYRNFRSKEGAEAASSAIYFATQGASKEVADRVCVPAIVALSPDNGARDVDPRTKSLRVTFSLPMAEGMSWTGGGTRFPKLSDGAKPTWSDGGLTCVLPVSLEPEHDYELGLNNVHHNNFQSKSGVPLESVQYKFRTGR